MAARILIVEDHPANMEMMTFLLESFGYQALSAYDGEEGLQAAYRDRPDLIVCDVHLPKLDGYGVVRQLKMSPDVRHIPVIAVTALAMVGDREKLLQAGFDDYISKPIEPERFIGQVEGHLPAALRAAPPPGPSANACADAPKPVAGRARILVVDDSAINRELIRDLLEPFGYVVKLAQSVEEGRQAIHRAAFDLIVCDMHMPLENGIALLREVKGDPELAAIPFVFLSASYEDEVNQQLATSLGVTRSLRRPIEPQALLAEIAACLPIDKRGKPYGKDPGR
ncbi:MAG: response regulator [Rhodocyclaceae bacterium]|nr:response regulator [Rhodocyclaceae bacterium]